MSLNRREVLRFGALGAAGLVLSSSASSQILPSTFSLNNTGADPLAPLPTVATQPMVATPPAINPQLLARAKAALGPKFEIKDFHEAVLSHGTMPVKYLPELVR